MTTINKNINTNIIQNTYSLLNKHTITFKDAINGFEEYLINADSNKLRCFRFKFFQPIVGDNILTYMDFFVRYSLYDDISDNINVFYNFIVKYIYAYPETNKLLVKHIKLLNQNQNMILMSYAYEVDLENLYSIKDIETSFSYFILFAYQYREKYNDNYSKNNVFWELIDNSFGYIYNLTQFIEKQITYFEKLQKIRTDYSHFYKETYKNLYKSQRELYNNVIKFIKIANKIGVKLDFNLKPKTAEQLRIFYNLCLLIELPLFNNCNSPILYYKNNLSHHNSGLSESIINLYYNNLLDTSYEQNSKYTLSWRLFNTFIINSYNILSNNDSDFTTKYHNLQSINYVLYNSCDKLKKKVFYLGNNKLNENEWRHKYHNLICNLFDYFIKSYTIIDVYSKRKSSSSLDYSIYNLLIIEIKLFENIISEIPLILDIYFDKLMNFDNNQIQDLLNLMTRILCDYNFKSALSYLKSTIYRGNFILINIWDKIIGFLENDNINSDNLINNLCQNGFDYKKLDARVYKLFKKSPILIKFDKYASLDYQSLIDTLAESFGDPITGELIQNPIILPTTKQIIEKTVIYRILRENQCNPFNNLPLTIEELDKYNQTEEIKKIANQFIIDLQNAKDKIGIK
jgi:hypothetical protein